MMEKEYKMNMKMKKFKNLSFSDKSITISVTSMALFVLAIIIPLIYVVIASFMDPIL